jgi:hypothetical protein
MVALLVVEMDRPFAGESDICFVFGRRCLQRQLRQGVVMATDGTCSRTRHYPDVLHSTALMAASGRKGDCASCQRSGLEIVDILVNVEDCEDSQGGRIFKIELFPLPQ